MSNKFVYVTYIRTTPEKLWQALIDPEWNRKFWAGFHQESEWKPGSPWKLLFPDGKLGDSGEVLEFDAPKRLSIKWRNEFRPDLKDEGFSRCTMELEPDGEVVKLTVTHAMESGGEGAKFITAVSNGWPHILSSLKSLLETGTAIPIKR